MIMKKVLVFLILLSCSPNNDVQIQTEPTTIPTNTTLSIEIDGDIAIANFVEYWTKNLKNYRPISNDDLKITNELRKRPDSILVNDSITCNLRVKGTLTSGLADENHPIKFDSHQNLQWWLVESYNCNDDLITNLYGSPFFQDDKWWIFAATYYPENLGTDSLYKECGYPCSPVTAARFATRINIDLSKDE